MKKTEIRKMALLIILFGAFGFFISKLSFSMAFQSDGLLMDAMWIMAFLSGTVFFFSARMTLGLHRNTWSESPVKKFGALLLNLLFISFIVSKLYGEYFWHQEFNENRKVANDLILKIENYHQNHGQYPSKLSDLNPFPNTVIVKNGAVVDSIYYSKRENNNFYLGYSYGWYTYKYWSDNQEWFGFD